MWSSVKLPEETARAKLNHSINKRSTGVYERYVQNYEWVKEFEGRLFLRK